MHSSSPISRRTFSHTGYIQRYVVRSRRLRFPNRTQALYCTAKPFALTARTHTRTTKHLTSGAMKPLVPAMLVLVVSASIVLRKLPSAPGVEPLSSPPPSKGPKPGMAALAPSVSLLTSKSANKNRPSAWTRTLPGCVVGKKGGGGGRGVFGRSGAK